ncbi:MAG: hypothetical protein R6V85_16440 [Polyangia bacterium]
MSTPRPGLTHPLESAQDGIPSPVRLPAREIRGAGKIIKEGLYEAAEDLTNRVDLEPGDSTRATG